jgi:hypothetical protein
MSGAIPSVALMMIGHIMFNSHLMVDISLLVRPSHMVWDKAISGF